MMNELKKRLLLLLFVIVTGMFYSYTTKNIFKKDLLYNKYTLEDKYYYGNTERRIQWNKIDSMLCLLDSFQQKNIVFGHIQNYKNQIDVAPLVHPSIIGLYNTLEDMYGIEQYQSAPLYSNDSVPKLIRYGRDGVLVGLIKDTIDFYKVELATIGGEWLIPKKYIHLVGPVTFNKVIAIDRNNQNIVTLEKKDSIWLIRSMNPATTGLKKPPYQKETPKGMFVLQGKKLRMEYYVDGTNQVGGYAPYANRFCSGAYIHGIPVNLPATTDIEYSPTLGTTPRSHMCVRNATSHASYIYFWAPSFATLVFVFD